MPISGTRKRGASRMREQGYKLVQLWLDPAEHAAILKEARSTSMQLASWIRRVACEESGHNFRKR